MAVTILSPYTSSAQRHFYYTSVLICTHTHTHTHRHTHTHSLTQITCKHTHSFLVMLFLPCLLMGLQTFPCPQRLYEKIDCLTMTTFSPLVKRSSPLFLIF